MRRLLGLTLLYLLVAVMAPAAPANNVVVPLNRGWNAVGLQVQRLTALSENPAVRGCLTWNGTEYVTGSFTVDDLNQALAGRQGVWLYADQATSFTYSGVDDGAGGSVPLSLNGYQLVTFCTTVDVPVGTLLVTQQGQPGALPPLLEIGPNNEYTPVGAGGVVRPGRAYWALADTRGGLVRLNPPGSLGRISGRVNDSAGFQVVVVGGGSTSVNPDGSFVLENVEPGTQTVTVIGAGGEEAAVVTVDVRPGQTSSAGLIAPRPSGLVSGVVSGGDGQALAGVSLVATPLLAPTEPVLGTENGRPRLFARTNARGEYTLRGLVPGEYLVTASLAGFLDASQTVRVVTRQSVSANFVLQAARGATVRGQVTVRGGTPVRGAVVSLARVDSFPDPVPPTVVGPGEPPPGGTVPVTAPGGTFTSPGGPEDTPVNQLLPIPGGSPGVTPPEPFPSPGEIPPEPIPGPSPIEIPPPRPIPPVRPPLVTFTDADGHYRLDGVPPGDYVLRVYRFGLDPVAQPVSLSPDQTQVRNVVLVDTTGAIAGQVVIKANGLPLEGAGVAAWPGDIFDPIPLPVPVALPNPGEEASGLALHPPFRGFAVTDAEGRYSLRIPAGSYVVNVFAPEFADGRQPAQVRVGETTRADFALEPAPPGGEGIIGQPLLPTLTR